MNQLTRWREFLSLSLSMKNHLRLPLPRTITAFLFFFYTNIRRWRLVNRISILFCARARIDVDVRRRRPAA